MIGLVFGFSFVSIVLIVLLKYSVLSWWLKALLTVSCVFAVIMFYVGIKSLLGYPVDDTPSVPVQVIGSDIHEPSGGDKGIIYLWVNVEGNSLPRSIIIPYSKDTHKKLMQVKEAADAGVDVNVTIGKNKGNGLASDQSEDSEGTIDFVPPPKTSPLKGRADNAN